jgi:excisionase family DNA binding protein
MTAPTTAGPTLADVLARPDLLATLPSQTQAELYARVVRLEADLRAVFVTRGASRDDAGRESLAGPRTWTIPEVADFLRVPKGYVYELARQGKIPTVRFGKYVRVPDADLVRWLRERQGGGLDTVGAVPHGHQHGRAGLAAPLAAGASSSPARRTRGDHAQPDDPRRVRRGWASEPGRGKVSGDDGVGGTA